MTPAQLDHFRQKLVAMRGDLRRELAALPPRDQNDVHAEGDLADQSSAETDRDLVVLNRARTQKLLDDADRALARIDDGSYGICEDTGQPIGLKRLDAQPTATLSIEAQEERERRAR